MHLSFLLAPGTGTIFAANTWTLDGIVSYDILIAIARNMSVEDFWILGNEMTGHDVNQCRATGHRRFREFFGVSPVICSTVWETLLSTQSIPSSGKPCHLLWALLFLKRYLTEHVMSSIIGADEKTIRKWIWSFVYALSNNLHSVFVDSSFCFVHYSFF